MIRYFLTFIALGGALTLVGCETLQPTTPSAATVPDTHRLAMGASFGGYTEFTLPHPSGSDLGVAFALNDGRTVVGTVNFHGIDLPFKYQYPNCCGLSLLALPPGAESGVATDINEAGDIVGYSYTYMVGRVAVLWAKGGAPQVLPGSYSASWYCGDPRINDLGWITWSAVTSTGLCLGNLLKPGSANPVKLLPFEGCSGSVVRDLNNDGLLVGAMANCPEGDDIAYQWHIGGTGTGPIPGGRPYSVNSTGTISGTTPAVAVATDDAAVYTTLNGWKAIGPPLPISGLSYDGSVANAVSDRSRLVGMDTFMDGTGTWIISAFTFRSYHGVGTRLWFPTSSNVLTSRANDVNTCGDAVGEEYRYGGISGQEIVIWLADKCDS